MSPPLRQSSKLPDVVGLCPTHGGEFYVPHSGTCPQYGCDEQLVTYGRVEHEALTFLLDAVNEARAAGAWSHWNANSRRGLDDALKQLHIYEEDTRPDA